MTDLTTTPPMRASGPPGYRPGWLVVLLVAMAAMGGGALLHARLTTVPSVALASPGASPHEAMPGMAVREGDPPPPPPGSGMKAVHISAARQQLIGVRTGLVERQRVAGTVRTVGILTYDETRVTQIHTKVSGWIEHLSVDYVGKPVRRGQALFSVYSPDLVTAQADYLISLRGQKQMSGSSIPEAKIGADAMLSASRDRLRRWDVSDGQIAALEKSGKASRTLTISSPFDGVVLEKNAFSGQYITPEMASFKLADLSTLWVVGQAFEYEAARFHSGDAIEVEFPYGQADAIDAKIDFIYPDVDPQTRRVRFRATLKNPDRKLKPDTYVTLLWHGEAMDRVMLAKEAVIDTGERTYVLLALADGYFEPRDVKLGPPVGDVYPVLSGVVEGDRVVLSAQFLVDSETNLASAMQNMTAGMPGMDMGPPKDKKPTVAPAAPSMPGMGMGSPKDKKPTVTPAAPSMPGMDSRPPNTQETRGAPTAPSMPDMPDMPGMDMRPGKGKATPMGPAAPSASSLPLPPHGEP